VGCVFCYPIVWFTRWDAPFAIPLGQVEKQRHIDFVDFEQEGANMNPTENGNTTVSIDTEYEQCMESWRFYLGQRPAFLAFALSIMSAGAYFLLGKDSPPEPIVKILLSFAGLVFTFGVIMFEKRTRDLYDVCIKRARALELGDKSPPDFLYGARFSEMFTATRDALHGKLKELDSKDYKLATLIIAKPRHLLAWQTGGIYLTYGIMCIAWLLMLFRGVYEMVR
jgi:hypothetical protein